MAPRRIGDAAYCIAGSGVEVLAGVDDFFKCPHCGRVVRLKRVGRTGLVVTPWHRSTPPVPGSWRRGLR